MLKHQRNSVSVLNNWFIDVHNDKLDNDINEPFPHYPHLDAWQCYDHCNGGNEFLEMLEKKGELIKMFDNCDEDAIINQDEQLEIRLYLLRQDDAENFHTFSSLEDDIYMPDVVFFCYRGVDRTCNCHPYRGGLSFKKKESNDAPRNSLILASWPFSHPPHDQLETAIDDHRGIVITNSRLDGEGKRCRDNVDEKHSSCSCLDARSLYEQHCKIQTASLLPQPS